MYERTRPVFVGEDDGSGLIYFATYYTYISEGEQLLFADLGLSMAEQVRTGVAMPVVHSECDCIGPVRAGDVLTHTIRLEVGARSTVTAHHEFRDAVTGQLRARGLLIRVLTAMDSRSSVPIPDDVRDRLARGNQAIVG